MSATQTCEIVTNPTPINNPTTITNDVCAAQFKKYTSLSANISVDTISKVITFEYTGSGASSNRDLNTIRLFYSLFKPVIISPTPYSSVINNGVELWYYTSSLDGYIDFVSNYSANPASTSNFLGVKNLSVEPNAFSKIANPYNPTSPDLNAQFGIKIYSSLEGNIIMVFSNTFDRDEGGNIFVSGVVAFYSISYNSDGSIITYTIIDEPNTTLFTFRVDPPSFINTNFNGVISASGDIAAGIFPVSLTSSVLIVWNLPRKISTTFDIPSVRESIIAADYGLNYIVFFGTDGLKICKYDADQNQITLIQTISPPSDHVDFGEALAMSGDGNTIAFTSVIPPSPDTNGEIDIFVYVKSGDIWTPSKIIRITSDVILPAINPILLAMGSSNLIAYGNQNTGNIRLYNSNNGELINQITIGLPLTYMSISADNRILSVGSGLNIFKYLLPSLTLPVPSVPAKLISSQTNGKITAIINSPGLSDTEAEIIVDKAPENSFSIVFSPDFTFIDFALSMFQGVAVNNGGEVSNNLMSNSSNLIGGGINNDNIEPPQIFITMQNNTVTKDVIEVLFRVVDGREYDCGSLGKYCGNVISMNGETQFQVFFLEVNCAVIGDGALFSKILCFNTQLSVDGFGFIGYILLKILLGRLVGDEGGFDLKWAFRNIYPELIARVSRSIYKNALHTLRNNIRYEDLLMWC